jgi:hypothetical protein
MTIAKSDVDREIQLKTEDLIKSSCMTHGLHKCFSYSSESYVTVSDY